MVESGMVRQLAAAAAGCLGCLALGAVIGYTSPAIPSMQNEKDPKFEVDDDVASWIGSFNPLGALVGSFFAGHVIDLLGRKGTLMFVSAPGFIAGWLLVGFSVHIAMMYVGRFIGGLMVGLTLVTNSMYIVETSESKYRGMTGSFPQLFIVTGILFAYAVGAGVEWNILAFICCGLVVPFFFSLLPMPESPTWYLMKGRKEDAVGALKWLRQKSEGELKLELEEMENAALSSGDTTSFSPRELLKPSVWKPCVISLALMFFQQTCGVNAVIYYTVSIFEAAGASIDDNLSTIIVGIVQVVATLVCSQLADRLGRRILLLASSILMMISLVLIGVYFILKEKEINEDALSKLGWLPLVSLLLFITGFSVGLGPLPWLITSEIIPAHVRSFAVSFANAFNWTFVFVVTISFMPMNKALGTFGTFWLFGGFCLAATIFIFFFQPETKGKSLEEITMLFT